MTVQKELRNALEGPELKTDQEYESPSLASYTVSSASKLARLS